MRSSRDVAIAALLAAVVVAEAALQSRQGLVRGYNVSGFIILILYFNLREGAAEPSMQALLLAVIAAVRRLP